MTIITHIFDNKQTDGSQYDQWNEKTRSTLTMKRLLFLHLAPGILVLTMIILFSQPVISGIFGIDKRLSPVFGLVMGSSFILVELIYLYYIGKKHNNSYSLKGVIYYTDKSSKKEYLIIIPLLTLFILFVFIVITPIFQPFFVDTFFWWWPKEYNYQSIFQNTEFLASMSEMEGIYLISILYILFPALIMPFIEELYFRGYLMKELDKKNGIWAVLINSVLFSVYHFFSPWENFIRIFAVTFTTYIAYNKKDIRLSLIPHVIANFTGAVILVIVIFIK